MEKCVRSTVIACIWIPTLSLPSYVALDTLVDLWKHFFNMEPWRRMLILGKTRNSVDYIVDFLGWRCPWQSRWGLLLFLTTGSSREILLQVRESLDHTDDFEKVISAELRRIDRKSGDAGECSSWEGLLTNSATAWEFDGKFCTFSLEFHPQAFPIKVNRQGDWRMRSGVGMRGTFRHFIDVVWWYWIHCASLPSPVGSQIHIKLDNNLDNFQTSPGQTHASCFHPFCFSSP